MQMGHVVLDAARWVVETEETASKFDAGHYGKLLEKTWAEVAFVFSHGPDAEIAGRNRKS